MVNVETFELMKQEEQKRDDSMQKSYCRDSFPGKESIVTNSRINCIWAVMAVARMDL